VENREAVQADLAKEKIDTGIHYPVPLHLQKAYSGLGYKHGAFPVCEKAAERIVSLPCSPAFQRRISAVVHAVVRSAKYTGPQNVLVV